MLSPALPVPQPALSRPALAPALTGACMTVTDGPVIDLDALRRKYAEERAKRLRPDGNDQYLRLAGQLGHYLDRKSVV